MRHGLNARTIASQKPAGRVGFHFLGRLRQFIDRLGSDSTIQLKNLTTIPAQMKMPEPLARVAPANCFSRLCAGYLLGLEVGIDVRTVDCRHSYLIALVGALW